MEPLSRFWVKRVNLYTLNVDNQSDLANIVCTVCQSTPVVWNHVVLLGCGHSFLFPCIERCFARVSSTEANYPNYRRKVDTNDLHDARDINKDTSNFEFGLTHTELNALTSFNLAKLCISSQQKLWMANFWICTQVRGAIFSLQKENFMPNLSASFLRTKRSFSSLVRWRQFHGCGASNPAPP